MSEVKRTKYAFFGLCCLFSSLLLLPLSGCNATSDPKVYYQATGSWEGTIGADRVRGIIAPDGRYHLAVVDATGAFLPGAGEYVGEIILADRENNIGWMSIVFLRPPANAGEQQQASFKLSGTRLFSRDAPYIELSRTSDANAPAAQLDVAGRWSLAVSENAPDITALIVDAAGGLSGSDGDACQYSGTLKLVDPAWNIFQVELTFSGNDCLADKLPYRYRGLAMTLPAESARRRLWLAANSWELSGNKTGTFFGDLAATINVSPVAKMRIAGVPDDAQSVVVKKIAPLVELDAQESSDANHDNLTFNWSGTDPVGTALNIQGTGGAVSFSPARDGLFTLRLMVNDGFLDSAVSERQIQIVWAPDPFVDCGNGTVLATESNPPVLWLKNAGCDFLNLEEKRSHLDELYWQWGVNTTTAQARVGALAEGVCGLTDGSAALDWRLPTRGEFEQVIYPGQFPSPPQLLNSTGIRQWSEGDVFDHVGITNNPSFPFYRYWTADSVEPGMKDPDFYGRYIADFDYADPRDRITSYAWTNPTAVWPVRTASEAEKTQCLQATPQP